MAIINLGGGGKTKFDYIHEYNGAEMYKTINITIDGTYTYPTELDGVELDHTLSEATIPGTANVIGNLYAPFAIYKKIVVPQYFTTFTPPSFQNKNDLNFSIRHLKVESATTSIPAYLENPNPILDVLEYTNWQYAWDTGLRNSIANTTWGKPFSLIGEKFTALGGSWGTPTVHFQWGELRVPQATRIGNTNGNNNFNRYWASGSFIFPSCTEIIQIEQGEEEQTMRFPKLTTCSNTNQFRQDWSHGKFIWCVGKDLATLNSTTAGNIKNSHTNGLGDPIILHIPEGPSVTKNTLDSYSMVEGVHYIRDYGTDACYPEDAQYFS